MKSSRIQSASSIYLEHLEEASFLYEQRKGLFSDPGVTWLDIEDFENRFEAHIDGLVIGDKLALDVCKKQANGDDVGEVHAAVRVFIRQNRRDLVLEVLGGLGTEDGKKIMAVTDALKYELPDGWQNEFIQMLTKGGKNIIPVMANVAGYRRLPAGKELLSVLQKSDSASLNNIIHALGRLREQGARSLLLNNLQHEDEAVCSAAALALLWMGEQQVISYCVNAIQSHAWPLLALGIGGSHSELSVLLDRASGKGVNNECFLALGLLGDVSAIDTLLSGLSSEDLAESAAISLNLITGANLIENAFIPEVFEEDELFEGEIEGFRAGKAPVHPDGKPFGTEVNRTSQKPEDWQNWWNENRSRFNPGTRYRSGRPYSPECLLENLENEFTPHIIRSLAYEELAIRYGADVHFETDMPVVLQMQALQEIRQWVQLNKTSCQEGRWYFAGQLII